MGRYKTFSPPTDTSVWSTLTADNDVIGFGDATHDFFRGRRYVGEYKGEGLGSLLGSLWALVRPTLRDIGKSAIHIFRDIGKTTMQTRSVIERI